MCIFTHHSLLCRQHAGLRDGWTAVPSVLCSLLQVVSSRAGSHGHGHKDPHDGFSRWSTVPPARSLLQQCCHHHSLLLLLLLLLLLYHSNYNSTINDCNHCKGPTYVVSTRAAGASIKSLVMSAPIGDYSNCF